MKKNLFILCLLFSITFLKNVNAKTYYGDYYKIKEEDCLEDNNLKKENIIYKNQLKFKINDNNLFKSESYFKREKLVLEDTLFIDNYYKKPIDFIKESTSIVFVNCNINYDVNGEYNCYFRVKDIGVNEKVFVDIKKNLNNKEDIENRLIKTENKEYNLNIDNSESFIASRESYDKNKKNIIKKIIMFILILTDIVLFIKKKKRKSCRKYLK